DAHAHLCLWSRCLPLDHVHQWANCRHDARAGGQPSQPKCRMISEAGYGGLHHIICGICGEERFDPQPLVGKARQMLKEQGVGL
ncbi:MAG: hypothetical protein NTU41_02625, partial [Chloroflexi bacterium]|nr:hypothetical protein [Chloroflexota bacterium]